MANARKDPAIIFEDLVKKVSAIYPPEDVELVKKAYEYAEKAHADQKRLSGEPYICHPLEVACIIADLALDKDTVIAGLLHDVIEDTECSHDEVARLFSPEIAEMVEGKPAQNVHCHRKGRSCGSC